MRLAASVIRSSIRRTFSPEMFPTRGDGGSIWKLTSRTPSNGCCRFSPGAHKYKNISTFPYLYRRISDLGAKLHLSRTAFAAFRLIFHVRNRQSATRTYTSRPNMCIYECNERFISEILGTASTVSVLFFGPASSGCDRYSGQTIFISDVAFSHLQSALEDYAYS